MDPRGSITISVLLISLVFVNMDCSILVVPYQLKCPKFRILEGVLYRMTLILTSFQTFVTSSIVS